MTELWRDIDRVKNTPHMNWQSCSCSQCSIWRIVAALSSARAAIDRVEALAFFPDETWRHIQPRLHAALRGDQ